MLDIDRAQKLAALFAHCGERWREVIPLDVHVKGDRVEVGSATVLRDVDGNWIAR